MSAVSISETDGLLPVRAPSQPYDRVVVVFNPKSTGGPAPTEPAETNSHPVAPPAS